MPQWEYRVTTIAAGSDAKIQAAINQQGLEGWELVNVIPFETKGALESQMYRLFFKRLNSDVAAPLSSKERELLDMIEKVNQEFS